MSITTQKTLFFFGLRAWAVQKKNIRTNFNTSFNNFDNGIFSCYWKQFEFEIESHLDWVFCVLISEAQMWVCTTYCQHGSHLVWHACSICVCVSVRSIFFVNIKPTRFVCSFFFNFNNLRSLIVVNVWRVFKLLLQSIVLKSLFWFHDAIIRVVTSCYSQYLYKYIV